MCMVMMYLSNSGPSSFNALTGKVATLYVKAVWQLASYFSVAAKFKIAITVDY